MRIITGKYGRRRIEYPKSKTVVRPTMDRVKESMFNIIGPDIVDARCLSIFSGSGSLGLEALSRGAASCVFVDSYDDAIRCIKANIESLGAQDENVRVMQMDALRAIEFLKRGGDEFDYIFMDPPYYKDYIKKTLMKLEAFDILAHSSYLVVEHQKDEPIPETTYVKQVTTRHFGATSVTICQKGSCK